MVLFLLYFILFPIAVFAENSTKEPSTQKLIEVHDEIKLSDSIELKLRKADGKEYTIKVPRQEFEKKGFKAVPRKTCPPPIEKIPGNCIKCKNGNILCR